MKRLVLFFAGALLLAGALCSPIQVNADGGPMPHCIPGQTCKP